QHRNPFKLLCFYSQTPSASSIGRPTGDMVPVGPSPFGSPAWHRLRVLHQHLDHQPPPSSAAARGLGSPSATSSTPSLGRALAPEYNFVVVGAGSAGCVLAARLSEDPTVSVLLLEAGGSNQSFAVRSPFLTCPTLQNSERDWAFRSEPQAEQKDRVSHWPRGKTLGGSSSINYMLYVRGDPRNFDFWAQELGCEGWAFKDVLPFFKKSEDYLGSSTSCSEGPDSHHGKGGCLKVTHMKDGQFATKDICQKIVESCQAAGMSKNDDYNGPTQEGASLPQITVNEAVRCDAASAFLFQRGALQRPNLTVATGQMVTRVIFQGTAAIGVAFRPDSKTVPPKPEQIVRARREVILSAGAVCTPWLLQLSGVGRAEHLTEHKIPVVADLPGVGQNLQDHLFYSMSVDMKPGCSSGFVPSKPLHLARALMEYSLLGKGIASFPYIGAMSFSRSGLTPEHHGNDLQLHVVPFAYKDPKLLEKNMGIKPEDMPDPSETPDEGLLILPTLLLPRSSGSISLRSADPGDYPVIQPSYLTDPVDMAIMMEGYRLVERVVASPPLAEICAGIHPDSMIPHARGSDEYVKEHIRKGSVTVYHPAGTAKMGCSLDPMAVVDTSLRVRGLSGLRVADASIMPKVISGNTNAPSIMIGERAAHMIKTSWGMKL
ncbi:unnamed protein product, partial [Polarella glacialis]